MNPTNKREEEIGERGRERSRKERQRKSEREEKKKKRKKKKQPRGEISFEGTRKENA